MTHGKQPDPSEKPEPDSITISRAEIGQQILAAFSGRSSSDAAEFLERLTTETQDAMDQRVTLQVPFNVRDGFLEKSMTTWVDSIFDRFQGYVHEFNKAQLSPDLKVKSERPSVTQEVLSYNAYREPQKVGVLFSGSLSTLQWALLVRGRKERIEFFMVPCDKIIAITASQSVYKPVIVLESNWEKGKVSWSRSGQYLAEDKIDSIAQEAFSELVKFSRGEKTEVDAFGPKKTLQDFPLPAKPDFGGPSLHTLTDSAESSYAHKFFASLAQPDVPVKPGNATHTVEPEVSPPVEGHLPEPTGAHVLQDIVQPVADSLEQPQSASLSTPSSVPENFSLLLQSVDTALDAVTRDGAQAFTDGNPEKAQQLLQQLRKLKSYRQKVTALQSEWDSLQ